MSVDVCVSVLIGCVLMYMYVCVRVCAGPCRCVYVCVRVREGGQDVKRELYATRDPEPPNVAAADAVGVATRSGRRPAPRNFRISSRRKKYSFLIPTSLTFCCH